MWNSLVKNSPAPLLWVISGPSGSGKTTICKEFLRRKQSNIVRSVSFTTRARRKGEKNAHDYFFVSPDEFSRRLRRGEFLEWQGIFDNLYATSRRFVYDAFRRGKDVLLCIDVKGALTIKQKFSRRAVFIFIIPPSEKALMQRIKKRARESSAEIKKRLRRAKTELSFAKKYDYIIVNDTIKDAVNSLKSIIKAKRLENVLHTRRKTNR